MTEARVLSTPWCFNCTHLKNGLWKCSIYPEGIPEHLYTLLTRYSCECASYLRREIASLSSDLDIGHNKDELPIFARDKKE